MSKFRIAQGLIIVAVFLLNSCSPKVYNQLKWQDDPIAIDGQPKEYEVLRFYSPEAKMAYSLSNDRENLYFCLRVDDPVMQQKVMRAGIEVYIDTTAKATETTRIFYPLPGGARHAEGRPDSEIPAKRERPDVKTMRQNFLATRNVIELKGFKEVNGIVPLDNKSGIRVKIDWDSTNAMIYEGVVPFKAFYRDALTAADSNKVFTVSVNIKALAPSQSSQGGGRGGMGGGGMRGGGMGGGMSGGGMRGGGGGHHGGGMSGGGGMGQSSALYQKSSFKAPFKLAVNGL